MLIINCHSQQDGPKLSAV